jgi:hypothetical protein
MATVIAVETKRIAEEFKKHIQDATSTDEYDRVTQLFRAVLGHSEAYMEIAK